MGSVSAWIEILKDAGKDIVIWGVGMEAQNVYDLLLGHGIECSYFLSDDYEDRKRLLFGKKIIGPLEMRKRGGRIVMLDCFCKDSAWGTDAVDYYDYLGFRRNKDLFAVKDYLEIPHNNLKAVLKGRSVLLTGDAVLCEKTARYLKNTVHAQVLMYADVLGENTGEPYEDNVLKHVDLKDVAEGVLCLIVMPDIYAEKETVLTEKRREIIRRLQEKGIWNYTDYFSRLQSFIAMEKEMGQQ